MTAQTTMPPQRGVQDIYAALVAARNAHACALDEIMPAINSRCTEVEWLLLMTLRFGPHAASDLSELAGVTQPVRARAVTALEILRLVSRERDPSDRREVIVSITPAGRKLLDDIALRADALWCERMSREQVAELGRVVEG